MKLDWALSIRKICEEKRWLSPMPVTIFEGKERDEDRYKRLDRTSNILKPEIGGNYIIQDGFINDNSFKQHNLSSKYEND